MASLLYRRCARAVAQRPFASTSQCTLDMHGCRHQTVRAASSASDNGNGQKKPPSTPSIRKTRKDPFADPDFTLEHFLLRDKCVKLWRDFLRASRNIPNPEARRETIDWLRDEHFEGPSGLRNVSSVVSDENMLESQSLI